MKIDKKGVADFFEHCGVTEGDAIILHADALVTAELEGNGLTEKMDTLFDGILASIGSEGTLVVPTFTYSATKGEIFDVHETSSDVGIISEYFRKRNKVVRSQNPVFSVASFGKNAAAFAGTSAEDCFGEDTCFDLQYRLNAWIFTLGCSMDRITFIHYVDQSAKVDYRFFKYFPATIVNGTETKNITLRYLVRDLNRKTWVNLNHLKTRLKEKGLLHTAEIGRALLSGVRTKDFFDTAIAMIKEKPNSHIQEGYE